jgi:predicted nucleic acid-binding protein
MSTVCCDTSLLISFYGNNSLTPRAKSLVRSLGQPLSLTILNQLEFENAVRALAWRKICTGADATAWQDALAGDLNSGEVLIVTCDLSAVVAEARRLTAKHVSTGGYRVFDILLVAAALEVGATHFLTFHANQRKLAQAEKLKVAP